MWLGLPMTRARVSCQALCHPGFPWKVALLLVYFCGADSGAWGVGQGVSLWTDMAGVLLRAWGPQSQGGCHWEGHWWSQEGEACPGQGDYGWVMVVAQPLSGQQLLK